MPDNVRKNKNNISYIASETPGPGSYRLPSDFGYLEFPK
jgi:hypothetical protein